MWILILQAPFPPITLIKVDINSEKRRKKMCNMNKVVCVCVCVCASMSVCMHACMCVLSEYWFGKTPSPHHPNKSWHKQWKKEKENVQHE